MEVNTLSHKKGFVDTYFDFSQLSSDKLIKATYETLYMTFVSMLFVLVIGLLLGLLLYYTGNSSKKSTKVVHSVISIISNIFRSTPFFILMILLIPLTRLLVGSFIGMKAAIPVLVISASPFYARLVEMSFREVDSGVLEASEAMGANQWQVIGKVLIPESMPSLVSGLTVTTITMIGFTAMAGVIGAGGLGALAWQEGFQRSQLTITLFATIIILIIVFIIQGIGDFLVKYLDKRK